MDGPHTEEVVKASLQPLLDAGADTIVLGCTHYPFLQETISRLAGPGVKVIDPAPSVALHLLDVMKEKNLLRSDAVGGEDIELVSSGDPEPLQRIFRMINMES